MTRLFSIIVLLALVALALKPAMFVIDQAEQGIIVQFGEPVGEVITEPGLHWKKPFIQDVRRFDKRIMPWTAMSRRCPPWAASSSWSMPPHAGRSPIR